MHFFLKKKDYNLRRYCTRNEGRRKKQPQTEIQKLTFVSIIITTAIKYSRGDTLVPSKNGVLWVLGVWYFNLVLVNCQMLWIIAVYFKKKVFHQQPCDKWWGVCGIFYFKYLEGITLLAVYKTCIFLLYDSKELIYNS